MTIARTTPVVVTLGVTQTLAWGSSYYLPAILAAPMAATLGLAPAWVFGAFSGALLLTAALGPSAGRAIDRFGGRVVLAVSNLVFAAALLLLAGAWDRWTLLLGWLLLGVGMGIGLYDAAFATLARMYGRAARAPITGITLIAGFASTVAWPLSAVCEAKLGWRGACLVWAALHLAVALPLNLFGLPSAREARGSEPPAQPLPPAPRHAMALLAFVFAAGWFIAGAMAAHLPRLLESAGASPAAAVAAGALIGPAQVAARLVEFGVLRRVHPLLTARLATLGHVIGAGLVMGLGAPAAAAFALLHGAGNGIMTIAKGTLPLALFGPVGYGRRQGLIGVPARLTQAAAPLLFGMLIDRVGLYSLILSAGLSLAALLALCCLRAPAPTARE
ncbi:MAG: MFS transporter [Alphaproteobacteria bacterium]|nr:MFS transporter [Alphaproteobacteria bacterium]